MAIVPTSHNHRFFYIISSVVLGSVLGFTMFMTLFNVKKNRGALMVEEVAQLSKIFHKIHKTAVISGLDHARSAINFLNVKSFAGSEVGPLNLKYPDKWEGPYLLDNLTIQTKEYELIRTHNGFYIVPGEGVTLPNGKVIGKDLVLDEHSDFVSLQQLSGDLNFEGKSMVAFINLQNILAELPVELIED